VHGHLLNEHLLNYRNIISIFKIWLEETSKTVSMGATIDHCNLLHLKRTKVRLPFGATILSGRLRGYDVRNHAPLLFLAPAGGTSCPRFLPARLHPPVRDPEGKHTSIYRFAPSFRLPMRP
jgi:hypothetical protein